MSCSVHGNLCAFPKPEHHTRCPFCHATWEKVTAPDKKVLTFYRKSKETGQPVAYTEIQHLWGLGETAVGHLFRHVRDRAKKVRGK